MTISELSKWDVTAVEVALELEPPRLSDPQCFVFSGPAEPRIRLAVGFALTSHLKRIVAAVDRAAPARAPGKVRLSAHPSALPLNSCSVSIGPMRSLLALQSKLVRAVEPGLAQDGSVVNLVMRREMKEEALRYVRDFIGDGAPPTFEPPQAINSFDPIELRVIGLAIYSLDREAFPERLIAHWHYPRGPK